ncbi:flavodoxin family protein [Paraferrimonas sedimenticola]|uniref:NAD(P)H-dependent oxidoreductase n=1 Tax=Paraferrimonas sedimenticola TaxID=375674 RepID=A0AA37VVX1_9GAMM|nr:flavodoxin family protein [Paraferrimonas sedimenticola]GLP96236.1 NAD(P)H-dependent oxidoreductase [Paraferrimonas sedimenticola]
MKTAIILGSSRSNGNTAKLVDYVSRRVNADVYDLNQYRIEPFNYDNRYQDDFGSLAEQLLEYDNLVLASPMYWYSASAQMKVFLDRISDLLDFEKGKGRQLRGKSAGLLASGNDSTPPECFEQMFELTFKYLGMNYLGMSYASFGQSETLSQHTLALDEFAYQFQSAAKQG